MKTNKPLFYFGEGTILQETQFMWEQNWRKHEPSVVVETKDYFISAKFSSIIKALIPGMYYCFS